MAYEWKINAPDEAGRYAILEACKIGKFSIFQEWLKVRKDVGLDLKVRDHMGQTIFHKLCSPSGERKSLREIVRRIVAGILRLHSDLPDLYQQDAHGQIAIDYGHYCVYCNRKVDKSNYTQLCCILTLIDEKSAEQYDIWNRKRHICHFYSKSGANDNDKDDNDKDDNDKDAEEDNEDNDEDDEDNEDNDNEDDEDNNEDDDKEVCPICSDEDYPCNFITNCGHLFHFYCLNTWCAKDRYDKPHRTTCPLCRTLFDENCLDSFFFFQH